MVVCAPACRLKGRLFGVCVCPVVSGVVYRLRFDRARMWGVAFSICVQCTRNARGCEMKTNSLYFYQLMCLYVS